MSNNAYKNDKDVYIKIHDDKRGKDHVDFYDRNPRDPNHESIHINWDSNTGRGNIHDTTGGGDSNTDIKCYLTTACMRHLQNNFDDECEELTILRWFRNNFVSSTDIEHYYVTAPIIVEAINSLEDSEIIYNYIYENVIKVCINSVKSGNYKFAYDRYKNSVLVLEEQFARPALVKRMTRALKLKI